MLAAPLVLASPRLALTGLACSFTNACATLVVALSNDAAMLDSFVQKSASGLGAAAHDTVLCLRAGESCYRPLPWADQTIFVRTIGSADDGGCGPLRLTMNGPLAPPSVVRAEEPAKISASVEQQQPSGANTLTAQFRVTVRMAGTHHASGDVQRAACTQARSWHYARLDVRRAAARASNARGSLHDMTTLWPHVTACRCCRR